MARTQKWTRNISKKVKKRVAPAIVNNDQMEALKRRAEDLGLILHSKPEKRKKSDKK